MIVATANALREQVQQYNELNQAVGRADSIKQAANAGGAVREVLKTWKAGFDACEEHLPDAKRADLRRRARTLGRDLARSQAAFEHGEHLQAEALAAMQQRAKGLLDETRAAWSSYATGAVSPVARLVDLAGSLPGAEEVISDFRTVLALLLVAAHGLPKSRAEVDQFHARLTVLDEQLAGINRYTPEQRAFLDKLRAGTATVADLTPELLAWCNGRNLGRNLKITR